MLARYDGRCAECGGTVYAGETEIRRNQHGRGWVHASERDCHDERVYRTESLAEQRAERWAEARFMGTTSTFWENEDYLRDHREGGY